MVIVVLGDNLQNVINVNIKDAYVIFEFEMDNRGIDLPKRVA